MKRKPHAPAPSTKTNADGVVFGILPVLEALRADAKRVEKILITEGRTEHRIREIAALAREHDVRIERVRTEQLERLTGKIVNHQGIAAVKAAASYANSDDLINALGDDALVVVLDGVEDPRNLGAILRAAECAGVNGVFIPERRAAGLTETVAKSSAGAVEHIQVAKVPNLNRLLDVFKQRNIWVVGTAPDAEMDYTEWDWTQASALVLGGESRGLHRLVAENCEVLVKIPMYGKIDSLNVSVAAGVILFEARRQRAVSGKE